MHRLQDQKKERFKNRVINRLDEKDLKTFRSLYLSLHSQDQVDIFYAFNEEQRKLAYYYLSSKEMAIIFTGLEIEDQEKTYREMDINYSTEMFNEMFTDDVAMFLNEIDPEQAEEILSLMEPNRSREVKRLMSYADETAGSIMTTDLIYISLTDTVAEVHEKLRDKAVSAEIVYYLYVIDEEQKLVGVVSLRDLITAALTDTVESIMSTKVISVPEDMDQEDVGKIIKKYDFLAVPVVSRQNHLLGIITVDDIMDILEEETTEDFEDISAASGSTDIDLTGIETAKKRAPWIVTLTFLGLLTGGVIGYFEETLESVVLLSVFIPMIMDSAGNVGTQSLTVAVRGLALGNIKRDGFIRLIKRELSAGFYLGLIAMIAIIILISLIYQNWLLAVIVGVSLLCTLTISTVVGFVIPLIINKLNFDPAIASGPFITTINDIVGLIIYFSIATALMAFL